jgi:hypothetical protein
MELYQVISVLDRLRHDHLRYDGVRVNWFVANRRMPVVRYKTVIKAFDTLSEKDKLRPTELIKELFTHGEAQALKQYLEATCKQRVEIIPFALPVEAISLGFKGHPLGSSSGFYQLCDEKGYSLSFRAWGFYDVEGLKPALCLRNVLTLIKRSLMRGVRSTSSLAKQSSTTEKVAV